MTLTNQDKKIYNHCFVLNNQPGALIIQMKGRKDARNM